FGRVFCSWICPKNTFSDCLDALSVSLFKHSRPPHAPATVNNPSALLLWGILAALVLVVVIVDFPLLGYLSLPGIISSQIVQAIMNSRIGMELGLLILIIVLEVILARRFWCKFLCPVGAFLSLFRTKHTLKLCYMARRCVCEADKSPCQTACPLALSPKRPKVYPYCLNCGACVSACEKTGHNALRFRLGRKRR
ncbi:MAG: 4Fe-4S binding protein, partial [bacterium]|nr:4Fe-4S binding protein [bacterium]